MNYAELLEKYNSLLREIQKLQTENSQLKDQLRKTKQPEGSNLNVSDLKVVVVTRPKEDFQGKNPKGLVEALVVKARKGKPCLPI